MRRPKAVWVNTGLAVLLAGAGLGAYLSIGDPPKAQLTAGRRVTVAAGTVTSTVGGTGNAASANSAGVDFAGSGGTLTALNVQPGQKVTAGQSLARIDATSAQQTLQTAQTQLASARAQYDQTVNGATPVQRQKDQLAIQSAQLSLNAANSSLTEARQQLATDTAQHNQLVAQAQDDLRAGTGTQAQLSQAEQTRTATLAKDRQAITQAQQQVAGAKNQLAQQKLTATANVTPTTSAVAQANAQLNSAKVAVTQARKAVEQTLLKAPQAGTVISVFGRVGQVVAGGGSAAVSSSGSSSGSSGSGSGTSGSGTSVSGTSVSGTSVSGSSVSGSSGSAAAGGTGSSGSSVSSGSSSSFIVIADLATLTVTANIAEADAASVKAGQDASVTFPAAGAAVTGKVTQISLSSITSNNVIQYPVTVTLQRVPDTVRLGASATVSITTGSVDDALYVPSGALTSVGRTHTVTVVRDGTESVVQVRIGLVGDRGTQIVSGLSAGDVVVFPTASSTTTSGGFPRLGSGLGGSLGGGRG